MSYPLIFISYSHKDKTEKETLLSHLQVLQNQEDTFRVWSDDEIGPGDEWELEIERVINQATIAILLVTSNFLSSKLIRETEILKLLERRKHEGLTVIPIIARACAWQSVGWLDKVSVRPKDHKPVWANNGRYVDDKLAIIVEEIAKILSHNSGNVIPKERILSWQRFRTELEGEAPENQCIFEVIDTLQMLNLELDRELIVYIVSEWLGKSLRQVKRALEKLEDYVLPKGGKEQLSPLKRLSALQDDEIGQHFLDALRAYEELITPTLLFDGVYNVSQSHLIRASMGVKLWGFIAKDPGLRGIAYFNRGVTGSVGGNSLDFEAIESFYIALQENSGLAGKLISGQSIQCVSREDLNQLADVNSEGIAKAYIYLSTKGLECISDPLEEEKYLLIELADKAVWHCPDLIEAHRNLAILLDELGLELRATYALEEVARLAHEQDAHILYRLARRKFLSREKLAQISLEDEQKRLNIELEEARKNLALLVVQSGLPNEIEEAQTYVYSISASLQRLVKKDFILDELDYALKRAELSYQLDPEEDTRKLIEQIKLAIEDISYG